MRTAGKWVRVCGACGAELLRLETLPEGTRAVPPRGTVPCDECHANAVPRDLPLGMAETNRRQITKRKARAQEARDAQKRS